MLFMEMILFNKNVCFYQGITMHVFGYVTCVNLKDRVLGIIK
jgi:hypothetical protein